jgi:hypothetical protein
MERRENKFLIRVEKSDMAGWLQKYFFLLKMPIKLIGQAG